MAENSLIEWTDSSFNPWVGCAKVSAGCKNCYAEHMMDSRLGRVEWGPHGTRSRTSEQYWRKPLSWNRAAENMGARMRVFCASLADVFEDRHELAEWRKDLWALISATPNLDWQLLTKRPENVRDMVPRRWLTVWPRNVWIGTSVENQEAAHARIPWLVDIPARVRFLSCEPLLGPLSLGVWLRGDIDWVIIGGESGRGARPFHTEWAIDVIEQCEVAGVPAFMKQLGARPIHQGEPLPARHGKGGVMREWPDERLKVRLFPEPRAE